MVLLISSYIARGGGNLLLRGTIVIQEKWGDMTERKGNAGCRLSTVYTRIDVRILYIP